MKKKLVSLVLLLCLLLTLCPAQAFAAEVGALEVVDWEALPAEDAEWEDAAEVVEWESLPAEDALEPVSFEVEAPAAVPTYELQAAKSGWQQSGGKWYYYENGRPVTGWKQISGKWYWFNGSGVMVTGWKQIGGKWYWFDGSGAMVTGWRQIGGKWYWFDGSGAMVTGWKQIGGKWYWFDGSGAMVTGWKTLGGKTYYFNDDGSMATGKLTIDGEEYTFDENGALVESAYAVGDVITFGKYEQDNDTTNGTEDIEWIVLDRDSDGNLLVISKFCLDYHAYHTEDAYVTWETCELRSWLNSSFLNSAFTEDELYRIVSHLVDNETEPANGNNTTDMMFILNATEAKRYYKTDRTETGFHDMPVEYSEARICYATDYAQAQGVWQPAEPGKGCCWWLRTRATDEYRYGHISCDYGELYVWKDGSIDYVGGALPDTYTDYNGEGRVNYIGVRPAMWITPQ